MKGPEQISVERYITVTVDDLDRTLAGWRFCWLAAHSRVTPNEMARRLAKGRGLTIYDGRRRLDASEERKAEYLDGLAEKSEEYLQWLGERNFQPLLRDLVVSSCVGFENFAKTIAVASVCAKDEPRGLNAVIFVPSAELRKIHKQVGDRWERFRKEGGDAPIERFLRHYLPEGGLMYSHFAGVRRLNWDRWSTVWEEAFRLRNAIVHSRGRPLQLIEIGQEQFFPFEEANLTELTLRRVDEAFSEVLSAFRISLDDL